MEIRISRNWEDMAHLIYQLTIKKQRFIIKPRHFAYPLVNEHSYGKPPFFMGKSTTTGPFSSLLF
jgi:hypothetical protein